MLNDNTSTPWGAPRLQWICEHCGAVNNDRGRGITHVWRDRLAPESPLLDLCGPCWRKEGAKVQDEEDDLFSVFSLTT
jgi:hypothetical protein